MECDLLHPCVLLFVGFRMWSIGPINSSYQGYQNHISWRPYASEVNKQTLLSDYSYSGGCNLIIHCGTKLKYILVVVVVCQHTNCFFLCLQTVLGLFMYKFCAFCNCCWSILQYVCPISCITVLYDLYSTVMQVQCN